MVAPLLLAMLPTLLNKLSNQGWFGKSPEEQSRESSTSTTDTTDTDITALIDKVAAKRAALSSSTETAGNTFLTGIKGQHKQRLSDLAALLGQREEDTFSAESPDILESLSSKGLLHSSGVGEAFGREKARLGQQTASTLQQQSLADMDTEQKIAEDIQNRLFGIESSGLTTDTGLWESGLQRKYSLQDLTSQESLAREIANTNAGTANTSSSFNLLGQLLPILLGGKSGSGISTTTAGTGGTNA